MFCPRCGQANDDIAKFCQTCGAELSGTKSTGVAGVMYGGFWKRFAALIIDLVIVSAATGILSAATLGVGSIAFLFLPWIYEALMLSSEKQATVGKLALGMIVTDTRGGRITFLRATGRHFAKYVSAFILGIGFLMAAFTEKKQALHDMIADTLVIDSKRL